MIFKVRMPTEQELDAQRSIRTYYNYVSSWCLSCLIGQLKKDQESLSSFQKLQGGTSSEVVKGPFYRGLLTLKAMKSLPIKEDHSLAISANFWIPVQAYYAIHGFGLAILKSLGVEEPKDHRAFRSYMSSHVFLRLFPFPFNMLCTGDPFEKNGDTKIENYNKPLDDVKNISNLINTDETNAQLLAAKSLLTTRKRLLEDLFEKQRHNKISKGKSRKNLSTIEKQRLTNNLHPTSIVDLLYRMRVRSNYDDPEIFIYGQDSFTAFNHYNNLLNLVRIFRILSENIIRRKIGTCAMDSLTDAFVNSN